MGEDVSEDVGLSSFYECDAEVAADPKRVFSSSLASKFMGFKRRMIRILLE